jgi:hypothetical protein
MGNKDPLTALWAELSYATWDKCAAIGELDKLRRAFSQFVAEEGPGSAVTLHLCECFEHQNVSNFTIVNYDGTHDIDRKFNNLVVVRDEDA